MDQTHSASATGPRPRLLQPSRNALLVSHTEVQQKAGCLEVLHMPSASQGEHNPCGAGKGLWGNTHQQGPEIHRSVLGTLFFSLHHASGTLHTSYHLFPTSYLPRPPYCYSTCTLCYVLSFLLCFTFLCQPHISIPHSFYSPVIHK